MKSPYDFLRVELRPENFITLNYGNVDDAHYITFLDFCLWLDLTMAPNLPQPRVEGVSLSGAMARLGGWPPSRSTTFDVAPA